MEEKKVKFRLEHLPLNKLVLDCGYQRPTTPRLVREISNHYDEARVGVIVVSERDGNYNVLDGNHRVRGALANGVKELLCQIMEGLSHEEEAHYCGLFNKNRRAHSIMDTYRTGLVEHDPICVNIDRIVRSNNFIIVPGSKSYHKISSIDVLFYIHMNYGVQVLDDTLCLIASTWNGIEKATQAISIFGVAMFVHKYGMRDFSDRLKDKFYAVSYEYSDRLHIIPGGNGRKWSISMGEEFCKILVEYYNKSFGGTSKKRIKWED